ncbi:hypothetical protein K488DRAFT_15455, partial [Vararia minispora EC-137]
TCNSGSVQCCNQVQEVSAPTLSPPYALIPGFLQGANFPVGTDCSPLALGAGGQCNQQTVCCD